MTVSVTNNSLVSLTHPNKKVIQRQQKFVTATVPPLIDRSIGYIGYQYGWARLFEAHLLSIIDCFANALGMGRNNMRTTVSRSPPRVFSSQNKPFDFSLLLLFYFFVILFCFWNADSWGNAPEETATTTVVAVAVVVGDIFVFHLDGGGHILHTEYNANRAAVRVYYMPVAYRTTKACQYWRDPTSSATASRSAVAQSAAHVAGRIPVVLFSHINIFIRQESLIIQRKVFSSVPLCVCGVCVSIQSIRNELETPFQLGQRSRIAFTWTCCRAHSYLFGFGGSSSDT